LRVAGSVRSFLRATSAGIDDVDCGQATRTGRLWNRPNLLFRILRNELFVKKAYSVVSLLKEH